MKQKMTKAVEEYLRQAEPSPMAASAAGDDVRDSPPLEHGPQVNMPELMSFLADKQIADLPDGGGLAAIRKYIEDVVTVKTKNRPPVSPE